MAHGGLKDEYLGVYLSQTKNDDVVAILRIEKRVSSL